MRILTQKIRSVNCSAVVVNVLQTFNNSENKITMAVKVMGERRSFFVGRCACGVSMLDNVTETRSRLKHYHLHRYAPINLTRENSFKSTCFIMDKLT